MSYLTAVVSFLRGGDKAKRGFLTAGLLFGRNIKTIFKNHRTNKCADDTNHVLTFGKEFLKVILVKTSTIEIAPSNKYNFRFN